MSTYSEKLKDPRWQRKRLLVCQRDNWTCRDCANSHNSLEVHHIRYAKEPWDIEDQFLLTLCEGCHDKRGEIEKAAKLALDLLFAKLPITQVIALANYLADYASYANQYEQLLAGQLEFLSETRFINHGKEYPESRAHIEAVIGRIINWEQVA
jgi:hypothetical protein